jgi:hypothetical protein
MIEPICPENVKVRTDLTQFVGKIGAELGVQVGNFSRHLIQNSNCDRFYSIDKWGGDRGHDGTEYTAAVNNLKEFGERSKIIRSSFHDALPMFKNEYFDFVYIDGYAHTGQEEGETISSWWRKVKSGGCFAGHDYYKPQFPLTYEYVNKFVEEHSLQLHLTREKYYPSWFVFKP